LKEISTNAKSTKFVSKEKLSIELPASIDDNAFYFIVYKQKLYVLSSLVAEINTKVSKHGTVGNIQLANGMSFAFDKIGESLFFDAESATEVAEKLIAEVNEANRKIGKKEQIRFGEVL
jgi:hypothetical protein